MWILFIPYNMNADFSPAESHWLTWLKWCYLMKTLACVPTLIYHSVVTSMQIRKQKETSPAHPPSAASDASFPTCGESNYTSREKWNIAGRRKGPKLKRILLSGISFVSFTLFILDSVLSSVMRGGSERGAYRRRRPPSTIPIWTKKGWGCFPGGHRGCPNINYTFVHLWLTLGWPWLTSEWKRSSKTSPPPAAYSMLPTDCTWAINPLSTKWNFCLNEAIMSSSSQTAESNEDPDYSFHGLGCSEGR